MGFERESVAFFSLALFGGFSNFVCFWVLEILCHCLWDIDDHVFDHKLHLMLGECYYLIYLMWSFTILGDECMYFILIILSAPPRCMWHGRVTHDSNSLCTCSPKQILNMHKFRGSSYLSHTSQSDDIFHAYYHLSKLWSICCHQLPKRGRLKVQLSLGGFGNS